MRFMQIAAAFITGSLLTVAILGFTRNHADGYILEHEQSISKKEPGPHSGGGETVAFPFFSSDKELSTVFRKRILMPGATIGYHLQEKDEIYYLVDGDAEITMNGKIFTMTQGDALLTKAGSSHGLKVKGNRNVTLFICYAK